MRRLRLLSVEQPEDEEAVEAVPERAVGEAVEGGEDEKLSDLVH